MTQYSNRSVDIIAFSGAKPKGMHPLSQQLFSKNDSGQVCTGIQKLAQRWLLCLLTPLGSVKFNPDRGTDFLDQFSYLRSELDLTAAFSFAAMSTVQQLREEDTPNTPPDEILANVTLEDLTIRDADVILTITITSKAGNSREIILPLASNPIVI